MIPALVNHLWQSTLFALGAGLLTLTLRRNGAGVRYGLWFAASVKFLIPFSVLALAGRVAVAQLHLSVAPPQSLAAIAPVFEPLGPALAMTTATAALAAPQVTLAAVPQAPIPPHHAAALPLDLAPILLGVWALGLAVVLLIWAVRWSRIRAALRAATPTNLPAPVPVLSTPLPMEPCVVGIRRPVLIVPDGIGEQLSSAEWNAILAHELCHIRRRDNLTGAIHMLVEALFWFHPLVWWLGTRLVAEREQACDEAVVRAGSDSHIYAEGILKVCRLYVQQRLACTAGVSGANLKRRVQRILSSAISVRLGLPKTLMLAAAAVLSVIAPLSIGLIASAPMAARAQAASAEVDAPKPVVPGGMRQGLETQTLVEPKTSTPIVLAAIETALSPAAGVAHVDSKDGQVVTDLSQAAPDLPLIAVATLAQPASDLALPASAPDHAFRPAPPAGLPAKRDDARAEASSFVQSYAVASEFNYVVRLRAPLCLQVLGLSPDQDAAVKSRLEAVGQALSLGLYHSASFPEQLCRQTRNVSVLFTNDAQRTLDDIIAHDPRPLGDVHSDTRAVKTVTRPIQAWYETSECDDVCGPERVHEHFIHVMVLVDLRRTASTKLSAIADYVAMLVLSEPRFPDRCQALPSVLDLFAGPCPGRAAPSGLTPTDLAYLKAVYSANAPIWQPPLSWFGVGNVGRGGPTLDQVAGRMGMLLAGAAPLPSPGATPVPNH